jgi:hypothetical protein
MMIGTHQRDRAVTGCPGTPRRPPVSAICCERVATATALRIRYADTPGMSFTGVVRFFMGAGFGGLWLAFIGRGGRI